MTGPKRLAFLLLISNISAATWSLRMPRDKTKVRLVIFDWAGTTVDHGSKAPLVPFVRAFEARGVAITGDDARGPMGVSKKDHIRALLYMPAVALRWHERHGRGPTEDDVDHLYRQFMPLQLEVIDEFGILVPGVLQCVEDLRRRGIAIGATTGYFRAAAERVYRSAAAQGYRPDHCVCAEEVPAGRPAPWMIFRIMEALDVYPPAAVVKVGDTAADMEEGISAGAWSVGVVRSSSEVRCTAQEWAALPIQEQRRRSRDCRAKLLESGAHVVIDILAQLPAVLDDLNERLERGMKP
jgi:phosphonoacetaldehyde hydrolase